MLGGTSSWKGPRPRNRRLPPREKRISSAIVASAMPCAARARAAGFGCVKAKVGIGDDAGRLAAVRAVLGPGVAIRLDANGAWSVDEAIAALRALAPVRIELCEEPVRGLEQTRQVSAALPEVPVALDETASAVGALDERVCQAVCLKIASSGGISGLLDAARRARVAGYEVYIASTLDGPLGIAAALHAAAAVRPDYACGLATLSLFDGRPDLLPAALGRIELPGGPGLGASRRIRSAARRRGLAVAKKAHALGRRAQSTSPERPFRLPPG